MVYFPSKCKHLKIDIKVIGFQSSGLWIVVNQEELQPADEFRGHAVIHFRCGFQGIFSASWCHFSRWPQYQPAFWRWHASLWSGSRAFSTRFTSATVTSCSMRASCWVKNERVCVCVCRKTGGGGGVKPSQGNHSLSSETAGIEFSLISWLIPLIFQRGCRTPCNILSCNTVKLIFSTRHSSVLLAAAVWLGAVAIAAPLLFIQKVEVRSIPLSRSGRYHPHSFSSYTLTLWSQHWHCSTLCLRAFPLLISLQTIYCYSQQLNSSYIYVCMYMNTYIGIEK